MKATFLTLAIAVFICSSARSQGFHLGVKAGANITKISGKSFSDEFSYSYHLGGFAEIPLSKKIGLQPEVLFNQLRQDTSSQFKEIYQDILNKSSNIKLNYLSLPILLNYKASKFVSFQLGPQFGIVIDQNKKLLENGKQAFKNDFSMLGGVQFKISSVRIYGRYALGLNNLNDIDNKDKWKSQSFQVGVGLALL